MNIVQYIPYGKENAVSKAYLQTMTGLNERLVRKAIEDARNDGELIINKQDGSGYYLTEDLDELLPYYRQERSRALAILKRLKKVRKKLKEGGRL